MAGHRRRGSATFEFIRMIQWQPASLIMAGVGVEHPDVSDFHEDFPQAKILGFEPNQHSVECLKPTFPGELLNMALSDVCGSSSLFFHHNWKNGSSLHLPTDRTSRMREETVTTMRLDQFAVPANTLLWLDAEGEELRILKGAGESLANVPMINVEMTGMPRSSTGCLPLDVHRFLVRAGYFQAYTHTIRTVRGQFDAVYVRANLFKPEYCSCLDSVVRFLELQNAQPVN